MNEILNKCSLAGDKFMPEIHLKQPEFTDSACGPFTKNKERIQKFKETGDTKHIYQNDLDKACFQDDMAYPGFKYLAKKFRMIKSSEIKHLILLKNQNIMDIKKVLFLWFVRFLIKKKYGSGSNNEIKQNEQLAKE